MVRKYDPKEVLVLYQKRLSYSEIGAMLGLSKGQVAGALRDLRAKAGTPKQAETYQKAPKQKALYRDRFVTLKPAPKAHPLVRKLLAEMNAQRCTWQALHKRAGVGRNCLKQWRTHVAPSLPSIEACFNVLGYTLQPVELKDGDENTA